VSRSSGRRVAIAGIGYSEVYRGQSPAAENLTIDAARAAIADAGLKPAEIDGIFEFQYAGDSPVTIWLQRTLGTGDLQAYGDIGATGQSGAAALIYAIAAVGAGDCEAAIAFRTVQQSMANQGHFTTRTHCSPGGSAFHDEFLAPYGSFNIIPTIGMRMQRRAAVLGGKPEDYGLIALNARRWASMNERAVMRKLLTMDDYLASRLLCDPLRLLDCDYPVSGSCAIVVTTEERARNLRQPVVIVDSRATATGDGDWIFGPNFMEGGTTKCAERLWARASVGVNDIDVAGLYDGFTYMTLTWLEALGFCKPGEAGDWMDGGRRIGPGGQLALNTTGGQLAEGRLHGLSFVAEATHQLRGQAGNRQVPDAKAAVVCTSFGPGVAGLVLLRR
jgi:acetyl-CoA acetyltransferase